MLAAGDFVLRRVLKFVLKRSLRNIIKTNLDLDQLSVTLGEGRLELREVLLSTDYLNQHLAGLPWEVTAAFVGSVAAAIPLAALYSDSCVVRLDEVFLTLRPRTAAPPPAAKPPGAEHQPVPGSPSGAAAAGAGASETAGESAVAEGVKLIAGGLEALLQRMRVAATRVVLRLELPAGEAGPRGACHVVTLSLGQAEYCGSSSGLPGVPDGAEAAGEQAPAAVRVTKSLSFSGLTLELQPAQARAPEPAEACLLLGTSAEGSAAGCSGVVDVQLAWGLRPHARPRVSLAARLDPLQVQLRPQDVLALAAVAAAAARLPGAFAAAATQPERQAASAPPMGVSSALEHPGSRSFIEGLMLPDCEGLVAEALQTPPLGRGGADSITGQEEVDEFFDAKSLLGSLQASYASFMSAHDHLGASQSQWLYGPAAALQGPALEASLHQAHDLAASVRQLGAEEPVEWEVALSLPSLSLGLLYPEKAAAPGDSSSSSGGGASPCLGYAPRLCLELGEVAVAAAGGAGGVQCGVTLRQLEAAEHLVQEGEADSGGGEGGGGALPEEAARVPCVLPPLGFAPRPLPTCAGSYPLPPQGQPRGLGPTLSQLSDLQASLYQSVLQASTYADPRAAPRLHVLPVLSCGGGAEGAAPASVCGLVHVSLARAASEGARRQPQREEAPGDVTVTAALEPLNLWISLPFLERLRAYLEPVQAGLAAAAAASSGAGGGAAGAEHGAPPASGSDFAGSSRAASGARDGGCAAGAKAAVSAAIEGILYDLQGLRADSASASGSAPTGSGSLRVRAYLPAVCLVAAIHEAAQPPAPPGHGYSYVAADLGMEPAAAALVVQGLGRLQQQLALCEVQALVEQLAGAPHAPVLQLQQACTPPPPATSVCEAGAARGWDCSLVSAHGALHLVGGVGVEGESVLGHCLFAHQVGALAPPGHDSVQPGLVVEVQWSPGRGPSPSLLQDSWHRMGLRLNLAQEPSEEQGRWESDKLDAFTFRHQCIQTSALYVRATAPALVAALSPPALAALANFADGLLQLAPQPPAEQQAGGGSGQGRGASSGVQVAVEVEVPRASCQLLEALPPWHSPPSEGSLLFHAQGQGLYVLSMATLSGMPGSGAVVLSLDGLDVRSAGDPAGGDSAGTCVLHRPAGGTVDGREVSGVEVVHIARPEGGASGPSRIHPRTGRYYIPADARVAISLAGWTLATEGGDPTLRWLQRLGRVFALGGNAQQGPGSAAPPSNLQPPGLAVQPGQPAARIDWALEADGLALRYEPPPSSTAAAAAEAEASSGREPVAAVVVVGGASCSGGSGGVGRTSLPVSIRCLALHVAAAGGRAGDWAPATTHHAAGGSLAAAGYVCVATEGEVSVCLPAEGTQRQHLEVTNHLLSVALTQRSALLLQQLTRQLGGTAPPSQPQQEQAQQEQPGQEQPPRGQAQRPWGQQQQGRQGRAAPAAAASPGVAKDSGVLAGVREDAYRAAPAQLAERLRQASVFIDGGWYEALENEPLSPAGSPPVLVDYFTRQQHAAATAAATHAEPGACVEDAAEGHGTWFAAGPPQDAAWGSGQHGTGGAGAAAGQASLPPQPPIWRVLEDYVDTRAAGEAPGCRGSSLGAQCALGELPPGYPRSTSRLSLRDIDIAVNLSFDGRPGQQPEEPGSAAGAAELQIRLHRLCVQADAFPTGSHHASRMAVSVHTLELRERRGPGAPAPAPDAIASGGGPCSGPANLAPLRCSLGWRQVLSYHAGAGPVRDREACMVAAVVEAVQPDPEEAPRQAEYRVEARLLPVRLQLEQGTVAFLQRFFMPFLRESSLEEPAVLVEHTDALATDLGGMAIPAVGDATLGFIQRCEVQPFTVTIDYKPQRVDITALRRGELTEILNLFPWGGVTLQFRRLRLLGVYDASTLGTALASAWLEDIIRYQVHKFLAGIAPIRSLCKVSSAAMQLVAIPVEHLFAESSGSASQCMLTNLADASFLRQMRRGLLALVRAIASEALGLGATVAGGAQMVLQQRRPQPLPPR